MIDDDEASDPLDAPLISDDDEEEAKTDDDAAPAPRCSSRLGLAAAVCAVAGAAAAVYLAVEFPIAKHEFTRLSCLPHDDLAALATKASEATLPYVWSRAEINISHV